MGLVPLGVVFSIVTSMFVYSCATLVSTIFTVILSIDCLNDPLIESKSANEITGLILSTVNSYSSTVAALPEIASVEAILTL